MVRNRVDVKYLDTILSVGATKMGMSNIYIDVRELDPKNRYTIEGVETMAHVYGTTNVFLLYTQNLSRKLSISVMAHELIHIWQMHTGKLMPGPKGSLIYDNKYYADGNNIPYDERPWEIEANEKARDLETQIRKELYD
jgi:predicted metallopeptidase